MAMRVLNRISEQTLKTRFSLFIALVYVFLAVLTFAAIHFSTRKIIGSLGARFAVKQALLEKSRLMSQIQQDLTLSLKMAHSPLLEDWMAHENDPELKRRARQELESYRTSFKSKTLFLAIEDTGHYYFADGRKGDLLRPRYTLNRDNPDDAWFYKTMRDVKSFELNIDYDNHLGVNKIWFNVVIRDRRHRKIGLCGSAMDISRFIDKIVNTHERGVETILFGQGGTIEGYKNKSYVIHNSKARGSEKKITVYDLIAGSQQRRMVRRAVGRLRHGTSGVEELSLQLGGKRYIAAISYMPEIRWYNLVLIDAAKVVGSRTFLPFLTISIISLLLVVVIVVVLLNRLVLQPLLVLLGSARQMTAGNFDVAIPVHRKDEIGELTMAFNEMAAMVKDHSENLEHKVAQRTEELHCSAQMLEKSNKKIMDSIRYAQLIQASILPSEDTPPRHVRDFFALYRPRDMVGGDFYFYREIEDGCIIAVVDCTGHGVPGAFMTMTTSAILSNIIDVSGLRDPAKILSELNKGFHETLHRNSGEDGLDYGLDIGLCRLRPDRGELVFSGARIDLHLVVDGKVRIIKGDRTSLGYRRSGREWPPRNSVVHLDREIQCYLATDGILDQSGGAKGWAMGRKRFMRLVAATAELPAPARLEKMKAELKSYQGDRPQRDDITVVGFTLAPSRQKSQR